MPSGVRFSAAPIHHRLGAELRLGGEREVLAILEPAPQHVAARALGNAFRVQFADRAFEAVDDRVGVLAQPLRRRPVDGKRLLRLGRVVEGLLGLDAVLVEGGADRNDQRAEALVERAVAVERRLGVFSRFRLRLRIGVDEVRAAEHRQPVAGDVEIDPAALRRTLGQAFERGAEIAQRRRRKRRRQRVGLVERAPDRARRVGDAAQLAL